jgi:hypothetical protein
MWVLEYFDGGPKLEELDRLCVTTSPSILAKLTIFHAVCGRSQVFQISDILTKSLHSRSERGIISVIFCGRFSHAWLL